MPSSRYKSVLRLLRQLSVYLRIFAVFAATIIILALAAWSCWWLPQGVDIIVKATETRWSGLVLLLMLFFWAYVSWYSGRILAYRKDKQHDWPDTGWAPVLLTHLPRLLGYLCFAVIGLAILQCPVGIGPLPPGWLPALLAAHILLYAGVSRLMDRWGDRLLARHRLLPVCTWLLASLFAALVFCGWINTVASLVAGICWMQYASLFLVNNRHKLKLNTGHWAGRPLFSFVLRKVWDGAGGARERMAEEALLFAIFNGISLAAAVCYITAIFCLPFANSIGSFPFVLLAFGILLGFANMISLVTMLSGVNVTVVYVLLVFVVGSLFEPHYVRILRDRKSEVKPFNERQHLDEFFAHWLQQRQAEIQRDSIYPVFFVLADGGASRSGYWTAAVLSRLEEGSERRFSRHLLCLSGASGGSVGNSTFFCLLQLRDSIYRQRHTLLREAQDYLKSDFLTYTLARMMGPDLFRPVFPFPFIYDRAAALEYAIEHAAPDSVIIRKAFQQRMSGLIARWQDSTYRLPILCINTTRMQDGVPGIVSNILIDSVTFGKRVDVLGLLKPGEDMRLSTAVVLGARFPYVSPAGRIENNYFVDGGYFDNSGAGAVHEMIQQLHLWTQDSAWYDRHPRLRSLQLDKKLRWYVIHITNSSVDPTALEKVHPVVNDLLAPMQTLIGSYGTQTVVNNLRLIRYLRELNKDTTYFPISLYEKDDSNTYAMNWAISDTTLRKMNNRLHHYPRLNSLVEWIRNNFNLPAGEVSELGKEQ
ncbi:patatin-like phospholipase family protein [Chitinophaga japonensis]|uniref:Patatin-like phospholipase n=1 Tax=Chitinophaga japonensis TaxID=104662 RepID=A0A562TFE3_CHIJA|nr:patatin-like phospholipase family protein [Chitinophaga japonensis]TWI91816.1 patatin-like phospholipase [Chitinophaga japonensis]